MAIVLHNAAERFPAFELLKVEASGIDCRELHKARADFNDPHLFEIGRGGMRIA